MIGEKLCYAAVFMSEALTVWLYLDFLFNRKKKTGVLISTFALGYGLLFLISGLKNSTINAAACCIVNYILIMFDFQCSKKAAVLHTAFLCFVMAGAEILVATVFSIFGYGFSEHTHNFIILLSQTTLSKLLYLVFSVMGSRIFAPNKHNNEDPKKMILFCSLPLLSALIAISTVYLGMTAGITGIVGIMTISIIVTLLIVNLIVLGLYNYLQKANEEYLTLQLSIQKEQADIAYYEALQEQFESQKILVHDMKKHLGIIDAIAKQNGVAEVGEYISELTATLVSSKQAKLSADPILNLILLHFCDDCKGENVQFLCDVREKVSSFMDASSITALYGNLLSNALESAKDSIEKQIELSVTRNMVQSSIIVSVVNSCDSPPTPDGNGGFLTKKSGSILHGVGLRSISRIVKKYQGVATMYFDPEKKQFHHIIQFPVPSE